MLSCVLGLKNITHKLGRSSQEIGFGIYSVSIKKGAAYLDERPLFELKLTVASFSGPLARLSLNPSKVLLTEVGETMADWTIFSALVA